MLIGRDPDAHLRLTDPGVSRMHAKLVRTSDGIVTLIDLESRNGTFVNWARVDMTILRPGDVLRFGGSAAFRVASQGPEQHRLDTAAELSQVQIRLIRLIAQGATNAEAAAELGVKPRTVGGYLERLYRRLELKSRAALVAWATASGLFEAGTIRHD